MHLIYTCTSLLQHRIVRIITFSSYSSHTTIIFKQLNILPFKYLPFLQIGLHMFKYESGQFPDALNNMILLRIDLCIIITHETRTIYVVLSLNMHYRDRDFRLVGVHVWNYIAANFKNDSSFSTFKKALIFFIKSEIFGFNLK